MANQRPARLPKKRKKLESKTSAVPMAGSLILRRSNILMLVAGVVVLVIGYLLLGRRSITAAPILLVLGYCVIIPLALVYRKKGVDRKRTGLGE